MVKGLFIGARVRILWSRNFPELAGEEGVIIGIQESGGPYGAGMWNVAPDIWGSDKKPGLQPNPENYPHKFAPHSEQLEPITPEGAQPLGYSFEQMMSEFGAEETVK